MKKSSAPIFAAIRRSAAVRAMSQQLIKAGLSAVLVDTKLANGRQRGLAKALTSLVAGRKSRTSSICLIPRLQTHKIDLTATAERAKTIDFSDPYLKAGLCLLLGKNSPIQSIQDADQAGKTIVVKRGTTGNIYASDKIKNAKVLVLDEEAACVLEVAGEGGRFYLRPDFHL